MFLTQLSQVREVKEVNFLNFLNFWELRTCETLIIEYWLVYQILLVFICLEIVTVTFVLIFAVFGILSTKYKQTTCDKQRENATE